MTNNQNSSWNSSPFSSKKQILAFRIMNFILPSNYVLILYIILQYISHIFEEVMRKKLKQKAWTL